MDALVAIPFLKNRKSISVLLSLKCHLHKKVASSHNLWILSFSPVSPVPASLLATWQLSQHLRPGLSLCTAPEKFWMYLWKVSNQNVRENLSEVVDHPSGIDVDEDHGDWGDDGKDVNQVPVDHQSVKRSSLLQVGVWGVQNGLSTNFFKTFISFSKFTSWSSMNFVLAKFVDVQEAIYTFIQCLKILPFDQI